MLVELKVERPVEVVSGLTPRGSARAIAIIDYGPDDDLLWVCVMDQTGECWAVANPNVRFRRNLTLGRRTGGSQSDHGIGQWPPYFDAEGNPTLDPKWASVLK